MATVSLPTVPTGGGARAHREDSLEVCGGELGSGELWYGKVHG